jgi:hypothetical protein
VFDLYEQKSGYPGKMPTGSAPDVSVDNILETLGLIGCSQPVNQAHDGFDSTHPVSPDASNDVPGGNNNISRVNGSLGWKTWRSTDGIAPIGVNGLVSTPPSSSYQGFNESVVDPVPGASTGAELYGCVLSAELLRSVGYPPTSDDEWATLWHGNNFTLPWC